MSIYAIFTIKQKYAWTGIALIYIYKNTNAIIFKTHMYTQYMQHVIFLNNPTFYDQIIMPINRCTSIQLQEEYITNFTLNTGISKHTLTFKSINQVKAGSAVMTRSTCLFIHICGKKITIIITLLFVEFKTCRYKNSENQNMFFFGYS